jgi:hypothetical protein
MVAANLLTKTATELFNAGQKADKYIQIAKSESGKSRFQIQINVPTFNRINIGKKVVREPMPIGATLKQAIKRRDALRNEAYGGFKKIDQQTLTKLLKTDKYKNLTGYKAIANQLHKDKYISRANQLFKTTSADKALALLGNFKLDAKFKTVGNPTRTISEVYDALKTTPQGSVLIKLHKEGKITDTSIRDKVTDLLRAKRRVEMPTITGGKSPKISYKGARNVSPEYKLWLDVIESTGRKKSFSGTPRFEIVKSGKGFTDYIIKDNLASYRGGRFGGQKFSLNGTEPGTVSFKEFVENSKSALPGFEKTELGKGTYSRMLSPYVLGKELNKTKLVYEGKPITLGQFLNSRVYMDSDEYAKHIGRDNWFHEGFEVEHIAGIGNSPYLTNLSTRFSNNQIESLLSLADTHYAKTGDAKQAFNIVADASKEMNLAGLKRNIKFGDKIMKFNHENKLSSLFNSLTDQLNYPFLGTSKEGVVTDPLKQALRRAVQNPVVKEQRKILKINKGGRVGVGEGGRIGKQVGGVTPKATGTLGGGGGTGNIGGGPTNKIGTIQSMLAGIGAGIIDIPRGAFTLGAALLDLGLGTNKAAKVEQWFDDLTDFDETAEQSTLAGLVRTLTNLGIPGAAAWKMGTQVTKKALLAKRNGNYFRITDPKLEERMKTALNAKGRIAATLGGAAAAGVSDAIFVGDPETVGTMGDLFGGGPTQLEPNSSTEASREVMNRIKFGLDGALFLGVIGGTGSSIKSAIARRNDLSSTNSTLDAFLSKLRPRGAKPQEFFDLERRNIGLRAGDVNYAGEVARKLDKHIDAIFPFVKNPFNKMGNKGRSEFMDELNETLLSGRIEMDVTGKSAFGAMDPDRVAKITKMMKDRGAKQADVDGVLDSFEQMRLGWAHMFSRLGYSMKDADPKVLEEFKGIIGDKFKSYLGSTYEIFGNRSLIPLLNYAPTEEAVNKAVKMVQDSARTAGKTLKR